MAHYPRDPPILHMWPADKVGQIHKIKSNEYYWNCVPEKETGPEAEKCRSKDTLEFEIEVVLTDPKAFLIKNVYTHTIFFLLFFLFNLRFFLV